MLNTESNWSVYKHIFPNGKVYIGITSKDPKARWKNGRGYAKGLPVRKAISKYGWDSVKHSVLKQKFDEQGAKDKEQELIAKYRNKGIELYNLTDGGEGATGYQHSEETKRRMSESRIGENNGMYGRNQSEDSIRKLKNSIKNRIPPTLGMSFSKEACKNISISKSGKNNPFYGRVHSDETRAKMSESSRKRWDNSGGRSV